MTDDESRIMALVEEILDSNCSPDEACREHPELLPQVRERLKRVQSMEARVHEVFPSRGDHDAPSPLSQLQRGAKLPDIPGYELVEVIGSGGMGVVYKANQVRLHRIVAIKMLLAGGYAGPRDLERFRRESEAVAALHHPNIVQVHDAGEHDRVAYFAMEFMEGGSLAHALKGAPQPARKAAEFVATLAGAVHAAHTASIIHRDLKPGNVLLTGDGIPKIADFGLARRVDESAGPTITMEGARLGTPSYMSPEQVRGPASALGPQTDVYALGAILYEMLTGRPPFRGETVVETQRQVVEEEPVRPARLNPRVPKDLQTICLKCLQKEPGRRYGSASALAEDLTRFGDGRPIEARPTGRGERAWRWCRRNPAAAALLATALALTGLAVGGGMSLVHQRSLGRAEAGRQDTESREVIRAAVAQAERLRKGFQFPEARAVLERAKAPLEGSWRLISPESRDGLRRQMEQAGANLDMVERLDTARMRAAAILEGSVNPAMAEPLYAAAFADAGLGGDGDSGDVVAAAVRASPVRADIVAALDDWASITRDAKRRAWLLEAARGADPDPMRDRLRRPELWQNGEALARLAEEASAAELSPQLATALGRVARANHKNAIPMLTAMQARFPQDFGVNYELGHALCLDGRAVEGLGYFRAALAVRPAALSHNGVGFALLRLDRLDEGIGHFREAIRFDPGYAVAHYDLGNALLKEGKPDEALDELQRALDLEPDLVAAHISMGAALCAKGRIDEALEHYQQAIRIDPNDAAAHNGVGFVLRVKGQLDESVREFQEALRLDPELTDAHNSLGYSLYLKGKVDEAIEHYRAALSIDPKMALTHHNLAGALRAKGLLDEAIAEYQEALKLDPNLAPAHSNLGGVLRAKGRLDEAIAQYLEAVRLDPRDAVAHIMLAKNLGDRGRLDEAVDHIMQGGRIDPNLAKYEDMFGDDLYTKACADIQKTVNPESEASPLAEAERAELRRRALDLLRADLKLTAEIVKDHKAAARPLSAWQNDPALASVREASDLAKLPDADREQWQHLWADVAAGITAGPSGETTVKSPDDPSK